MQNQTVKTKQTAIKRPLKVIPINPTLKPIIDDATDSFIQNRPVVAMINVMFKGESYLLVTRQDVTSSKPNVKKYTELKKLKEYLGRGNKELENFSSSLNPSYIKRQMKASLGNPNPKYSRSVYRFPKQDVKRIQRLRSNVSSNLDALNEIKYDWQYSVEGNKASKREDARKPMTRNKHIFGDIISQMSAGVHTESGLYLKAYKEKMTKILDFNKKPMTKERHIGLELEFMLPRNNKQAVKDALVKSPYTSMLCLGRDGSVTSDDSIEGAELKICSPISQMSDVVSFVTKVLALNNCKVDKSCGLHVHLDARNDDVKSMFDKLLDQQSSLFALVPKSRRNNQYCRPTAKKDFRRGSRYKSINSTSYGKFQTLEVRLHGGTIDPNKIITWTNLLAAIAYNGTKVSRSRSVKTMLAKLPLDPATVSYISDRATLFADHGNVVNEE